MIDSQLRFLLCLVALNYLRRRTHGPCQPRSASLAFQFVEKVEYILKKIVIQNNMCKLNLILYHKSSPYVFFCERVGKFDRPWS